MPFQIDNQLSPASKARAQESLDRRLAQQMAEETAVREFAEHLSQAVGTFLACTPYAQWPQFCRAAFEHSRIRAPNAAELYRNRLPADPEDRRSPLSEESL